MRAISSGGLAVVVFAGMTGTLFAQKEKAVTVWLTDPVHSVFFQQQAEVYFDKGGVNASDPVIAMDEKKTFQHVDGFGWALTGGSAQHLMAMSPAARSALLKELFGTESNQIGGSYLRVSIGASDLNDHVFSYDDLPAGQTDPELQHFDLGPDKKDVIPVLKEIVAINPEIKILGSPWSAPTWMKNNHDTRGGSLLPQFYPVYAKYLVKYILAMQQEGIGVNAITVQNEPLHPGNNPSMFMPAAAEAAFVKVLGPMIKEELLDTKIIVYDHNADRPDYPDSIYRDPEAAKWVDGAAFHLYGGKIEALTPLHDSFPDKNLYFTEQWVGAPGDFSKDIPEHVDKLIVGATRNWCKTVIEWNLAANSKWEPHTDRGGCDRCLGAVTIDGDEVRRNPAYYVIAHAAKYVRPGSSRIVSNSDEQLPNVAFRTPTGQAVLIVLNNTAGDKGFTIELRGKRLHAALSAGAVATYVFQL
jgi:glucosylceramidase